MVFGTFFTPAATAERAAFRHARGIYMWYNLLVSFFYIIRPVFISALSMKLIEVLQPLNNSTTSEYSFNCLPSTVRAVRVLCTLNLTGLSLLSPGTIATVPGSGPSLRCSQYRLGTDPNQTLDAHSQSWF